MLLHYSIWNINSFIILFFENRERKLEIIPQGINLGKRYYGPLSDLKEVNVSIFPQLKKEELLISWSEIKRAYLDTYQRKWTP